MAFSTINKGSLYQNTVLYTGNATARSITGVGFQTDLLWIKDRTNANSHMLADAVRGATKYLVVDGTYAEATDSNRISAFDSDGFSIGTNSNVNQSSANDVSWNWKANGSGSANTDGATASTVSVNTTAGFSIVKWTNSTSNATTVGHGLGVAPQVMITKTTSGTYNWHVYHHKLDTTPQGDYLILNNTSAKSTATNIWNDTAPTSTVFSTGNNGALVNNTIIAYCFVEKTGYSKFGSYVGNSSTDGTFVYTGFKPAFVLLKNSTGAYGWEMRDNKRPGYNLSSGTLAPSSSDAETTGEGIDLFSNGFKLRASGNGQNGANTYIYMAFAEAPFVNSNGVPCNAR